MSYYESEYGTYIIPEQDYDGFRRAILTELGRNDNPIDLNVMVDDLHLEFDDTRKSVLWDVEEGNRSVTSARTSPLGRRFLAELEKISWPAEGITGGWVRYQGEDGTEVLRSGVGRLADDYHGMSGVLFRLGQDDGLEAEDVSQPLTRRP